MNRLEELYPLENAYRHYSCLDGLWYYTMDAERVKSGERGGIPKERVIPVPSNLATMALPRTERYTTGPVWYQKDFYIPKDWLGEEVQLRFDGVAHRFQVYLNGIEIGRVREGREPIYIDITKHLRYGELNALVVKVHRELSDRTLPMGQSGVLADGSRVHVPQGVGAPVGGIFRSVHLFTVPTTRIIDYTIQTLSVSETVAEVHYHVVVQGNCLVTATLRNREGKVVATGVGGSATLTIENPRLWDVNQGYLYRIDFEVSRLGKQCDMYTVTLGIRRWEKKEGQLYLNNKPLSLRAYPYSMSDRLHLTGNAWEQGHTMTTMMREQDYNMWIGEAGVFTEADKHIAELEGLLLMEELPVAPLDRTYTQAANFSDMAKERQPIFSPGLMMRDAFYSSFLGWIITPPPGLAHQAEGSDTYITALVEAMEQAQQRGHLIAVRMEVGQTPWPERLLQQADILYVQARSYSNHFHGAHPYGELAKQLREWGEAYPDILFLVAFTPADSDVRRQYDFARSQDYQAFQDALVDIPRVCGTVYATAKHER